MVIGNRDRFILILLYDTAIRVEELINIRSGDVMIGDAAPSITIHGKGRKTVFMIPLKRVQSLW